ncbi:nucleoside-diphosphate-sugar epimerase family protein [Elsinoe ampelina]|uniref:Nucleoside-diphosphate-sugar epimerase family protein n=1 Tax=Elsinoe ampelina TaxID=302913 RepID=A0A6A6G676_9PEZI|nr:nucleoside-diphosphate-sugar epimerase family protein [Elsinoe ampelina]
MSRTILVTGATGKQGRSLITALQDANADLDILALTRDTSSASAKKLLSNKRVQLLAGDLNKPDEIFVAASKLTSSPVWGVFSVQLAIDNPNEEKQGKDLVDASLKAGVKHFVYSSIDRGGEAKSDVRPTYVPHFKSKFNVEQHLLSQAKDRMTWTILRPVAFFDNLTPDFFGKIFTTAWLTHLKPNQKLQLIATSDIGFFAAQALLKPDEYVNKKMSLAGDELTLDEFKAIFKQTTGQTLPTTFSFLANLLCWFLKDFGLMYKWFAEVGYGADVASLKKVNPGLKDFKAWLEQDSAFRSKKRT